jgi:hypothetical protein
VERLAQPGVALHYEGPMELAGHAYRAALAKGLVPMDAQTDGRTGTFTAVVVTPCSWAALLRLAEDLTLVTEGGRPVARVALEPTWEAS